MSTTEDVSLDLSLRVAKLKESLVVAWMAETGLKPSDSVICVGHKLGRFCVWVESKEENDARGRAPRFAEEFL